MRTLAPIDDGTDAPGVAECLLRAAPLLTEARLDSRFRGRYLTWRGRLAEPNIRGGTLRLLGPRLEAEVDLNSVLAVSYCANATSSGVCLFDEEGTLLTLWSTQGEAFDAWLGEAVRGYACPLDRGSLVQAAGAPTDAHAPAC